MRDAVGPTGRLGVIVPTGIATDDTTKHFFADCVTGKRLVSLFDFENREGVFAAVDSRMKFCLLTLTGRSRPIDEATFVFFAHQTADLSDDERRFTLSPEDLALINPNTKTAPVFRPKRDAEITKAIYRRVPVLVRDDDPNGNPWGVEFSTMFHMTNDSHLFRTADELSAEGATLIGNQWVRGDQRWLPLYESKMCWFYEHRAADVITSATALVRQGQPETIPESERSNPQRLAQPRGWVADNEVLPRLLSSRSALLAWRKVTSPSNERSFIAMLLPATAVGDNLLLMHGDATKLALLEAVLSTYVLDYVARQKLGGINFQQYIAKQLAVLDP
ncbi:MAG TPA: hypothetical protein DCF63_19040, partial [Planctomycetaceae bacterium]|nr:hypothetical protein [Planctomycetaceae bacterium]